MITKVAENAKFNVVQFNTSTNFQPYSGSGSPKAPVVVKQTAWLGSIKHRLCSGNTSRCIKGVISSWVFCETPGWNLQKFSSIFISIWDKFGTNGKYQRESLAGEDCNNSEEMHSWPVGQSPNAQILHLLQLKEHRNFAGPCQDTTLMAILGSVCQLMS